MTEADKRFIESEVDRIVHANLAVLKEVTEINGNIHFIKIVFITIGIFGWAGLLYGFLNLNWF